jgi:hypothetical protein
MIMINEIKEILSSKQSKKFGTIILIGGGYFFNCYIN